MLRGLSKTCFTYILKHKLPIVWGLPSDDKYIRLISPQIGLTEVRWCIVSLWGAPAVHLHRHHCATNRTAGFVRELPQNEVAGGGRMCMSRQKTEGYWEVVETGDQYCNSCYTPLVDATCQVWRYDLLFYGPIVLDLYSSFLILINITLNPKMSFFKLCNNCTSLLKSWNSNIINRALAVVLSGVSVMI